METVYFCSDLLFGLFINSLKVSALAGILFVLFRLCKGKMKNSFIYLIYLVLFLRLILPVNLISWKSPVFPEAPGPAVLNEAAPFTTVPGQVRLPGVGKTEAGLSFLNEKKAFPAIPGSLLRGLPLVVWLVVLLLLFTSYIVKNCYFYIKIQKDSSQPDRQVRQLFDVCRKKAGIKSKIRIAESPLLSGPLIIGIVRPVILIPRGLASKLTRKELSYVLLHELVHWKRKDVPVRLAVTVISFVYWFNPIISLLARETGKIGEVACDEQVLDLLEEKESAAYGQLLLKVLTLTRNISGSGLSLTAPFFQKKLIARRIIMISHYQNKAPKLRYMSALLIIFLPIFLLSLSAFSSPFKKNLPVPPAGAKRIDVKGASSPLSMLNFVWPVSGGKGRITCYYGSRINPIKKVEDFHHGIDIAWNKGAQIVAALDGVVTEAGFDESLGNYVLISHGRQITTFYSQLESVLVKEKQNVTSGQVIGTLGSSGLSTGPHLHFVLKMEGNSVNPLDYLEQPGDKALTTKNK